VLQREIARKGGEKMSERIVLSSAVVAILVTALPLLFHLTRHIGARSDSERKNEVYESGVRRVWKDAFVHLDVRFFLLGLVFLIFDVEVLYLFPWAVELRELGLFGIVEIFIFIGILLAGLVYIYRSGILEWS
jgi:NADH-quinone oxidoreductase subunit A